MRMSGLPWLLGILAGCAATHEHTADRPPNIIMVMADDVGVEAFSSYGGTSYQTPHIDALVARGMRFTHCYSQPLCTPTRVKIMTGRSNARNYQSFSVLRPGEPCFAQVLKSAGYKTAVVGKWQLFAAEHYRKDLRGTGVRPEQVGFDEWCLWQIEKLGSRYWRPQYEVNGHLELGSAEQFGPTIYTEFLLDFIEKNKDRPFLGYFPMALVHNPFVPTPDSPDLKAKNGPAHFGAMMSYMDKLIGRIADKLDELGIADNTLLIFIGDNGTHKKIVSQTQAGEVRGGKGLTNHRGNHVPMIAVWPGTISAGAVNEDLIDFTDFFPTFAEIAGADTDTAQPLDGVSFLPQLRGKPGRKRSALTCYYHPRPITRKKSKAVRFAFDKRFKLYGDGRLFDLVEDPEETTPIPGDAKALAKRARVQLREALDAMPQR